MNIAVRIENISAVFERVDTSCQGRSTFNVNTSGRMGSTSAGMLVLTLKLRLLRLSSRG